ncbi:Holliday junction branch migration protein RuvA [Helicobacter sp. MIT 05-5293]|uniref:Holliday junction branch migration protein RuvA n=1 Tax=Helicobacter sp. MIT 05-5293 TaxID=1548149 RepID=UPI00051D476F|nr:Holliday junction branch migration protein RuvA [Helicobacter sp. MIT 05-5293]TLD80089.1 Holliday junction branch migration protein RuvA [Helicobacter sp. MIT 05-5293]
MIVGLRGKLIKNEPTYVEIDAGGVIYGVQMSVNATTSLKDRINEEVQILCMQIVREDAHLLFGFAEALERTTFERLIKINGVGPKVAMAILSTYTPSSFGRIIADKDIEALKRVPGIGVKGAGKIMVDLAGFFNGLVSFEQASSSENHHHAKQEAALALESLGFKASDIQKALHNIHSDSVSEIVKEALKKFA